MEFIDTKDNTEPIFYKSQEENIKGNIYYFHGGGFIFGVNTDLPDYHIDMITKSGYNIYAFNYPLAPESGFSDIINFTRECINTYSNNNLDAPYFLWGRSAGAYLCLLATSCGLDIKPKGIISYYGYGLLVANWYNKPSDFYLKYPLLEYNLVKDLIGSKVIYSAPINPRFLIYLYGRQTGKWLNTISNMDVALFLDKYSLRDTDFSQFPPVLLAHNTKDTDVPYEESLVLKSRIEHSKLLTFTTEDHDFDKNTENLNTFKLIKETIEFLDANI